MNYNLGLYEKALPTGMNWRDMLKAGKQAGFDQLELSIDETDARLARLNWTQAERLELSKVAMDEGLPIRTMCLSGHRRYPLGSHNPEIRARSLQIMKEAIYLACDLGIRIIQLAGYDVYYEMEDDATKAYFMQNLQLGVDCAAHCGVTLGFETMETPFMDTITKSLHYVEEINSPYLGVYPDLGNLTNACELYGKNVQQEIHAGRGRMVAMHLKETVPGKYRDMSFGEGRVNFADGIREAYAGGVRMFTAEFWHDGRAEWQERLRQTNNFIRRQFDN